MWDYGLFWNHLRACLVSPHLQQVLKMQEVRKCAHTRPYSGSTCWRLLASQSPHLQQVDTHVVRRRIRRKTCMYTQTKTHPHAYAGILMVLLPYVQAYTFGVRACTHTHTFTRTCMRTHVHPCTHTCVCGVQAGEDALDRKRAAHLLKHLMPRPCTSMPAWRTWLMLHDVLEEFAPHLIFAAWEQVRETLHTPACVAVWLRKRARAYLCTPQRV